MSYKLFTIKDIINGDVAIINDGTLEQLKEVVRLAGHKNYNHLSGLCNFYYIDLMNTWIAINKSLPIMLPSQSVGLFLNQEEKSETMNNKSLDLAIESLRQCKSVASTEGVSIQETQEFLKIVWPNDRYQLNKRSDSKQLWNFYYGYDTLTGCGKWGCDDFNNSNRPVILIKEFLKMLKEDEFKWGEEVEVKDDHIGWCKRLYVGMNPAKDHEKKYITVISNGSDSGRWKYCRKIQSKLRLTLEDIAKKFEVPVESIEIISADITKK